MLLQPITTILERKKRKKTKQNKIRLIYFNNDKLILILVKVQGFPNHSPISNN